MELKRFHIPFRYVQMFNIFKPDVFKNICTELSETIVPIVTKRPNKVFTFYDVDHIHRELFAYTFRELKRINPIELFETCKRKHYVELLRVYNNNIPTRIEYSISGCNGMYEVSYCRSPNKIFTIDIFAYPNFDIEGMVGSRLYARNPLVDDDGVAKDIFKMDWQPNCGFAFAPVTGLTYTGHDSLNYVPRVVLNISIVKDFKLQ